jgi:tetratricopeptide (TPR) repeat protein
MKLDEPEKIWNSFKKYPCKTAILLVLVVLVFFVAAYFGGFIGEKGRQRANDKQPRSDQHLMEENKNPPTGSRQGTVITAGEFSPAIVSGESVYLQSPSINIGRDLVINYSGTEFDSLFKQAVEYYSKDDFKTAASFLQMVFEHKPDYPTVAYLYGDCLYRLREEERALEIWASVPSHEEHRYLSFHRGSISYNLREYEAAATYLRAAIEDLGKNDYMYWSAEALLIRSENRDAPTEKFAKATQRFVNNIDNDLLNLRNITLKRGVSYDLGTHLFDPIFCRRGPAFFLMLELAIRYYNDKTFEQALKSAFKAAEYLSGPTKFFFPIDESRYAKFLEVLNQSLYSVQTGYNGLEDLKSLLITIEERNRDKYQIIADMALIIRAFYVGLENACAIEAGGFELTYAVTGTDDIGLKSLRIESPFGNKQIELHNEKKYFHEDSLSVGPGFLLQGKPCIKVVWENTRGLRSRPACVSPMVNLKVTGLL